MPRKFKTPSTVSVPLVVRWAPSLAGTALYLIFAISWVYAPQVYRMLLLVLDGMPWEAHPFGDLGAILQASACWREGVNVYAPSACMYGGVYNYSPFLLRTVYLPVGPQDQMLGGILLGIVFLAALAWLPPAKSRGELILRICATCSETVIFALERANFDVVIFLLTLLGIMLLLANRFLSLFGYAVFLFAAACKFYPAVLLALAARERLVKFFLVATFVFVSGVFYMVAFAHGTEAAISVLPGGRPLRGFFGALDLPSGLALLHFLPVFTFQPNPAQYVAALHHPNAQALVALASKLLTIAAVVAGVMTAPLYADKISCLDQKRSLLLTAGGIIIVFCFFAIQNVTYRGIFLLLTLPGVWSMATQSAGPARRRLIILALATLFLLWDDFFRDLVAVSAIEALGPGPSAYPQFAFWLLAECLWWWVVIQLIAFIVCFLRLWLSNLLSETKKFQRMVMSLK